MSPNFKDKNPSCYCHVCWDTLYLTDDDEDISLNLKITGLTSKECAQLNKGKNCRYGSSSNLKVYDSYVANDY